MAFHKQLEHKYVDNLLRLVKKTECQGSKCLQNRDRDGFFKPGNTPWIGYPTSIKVYIFQGNQFISLHKLSFQVGQDTQEVNISCYIYHKGYIQMTLTQITDYDDGIELSAKEVSEVMGDIKVATFVLQNPKQYYGQSFYCSANNDLSSPNEALIQQASGQDYYISEWSEWTKCDDVKNKELVFRNRRKGNGKEALQSRYCRCSDLKELPSPR